jgi:hypothetical protein
MILGHKAETTAEAIAGNRRRRESTELFAQDRRPIEEPRRPFVKHADRDPDTLGGALSEAFAERDAENEDEEERHRHEDEDGPRIAEEEAQVFLGESDDRRPHDGGTSVT